MALISMRQMLDHAAEFSYGVPAFNVNNLEQTRAIMEAAQACNSPVIMQASAGDVSKDAPCDATATMRRSTTIRQTELPPAPVEMWWMICSFLLRRDWPGCLEVASP